jgi:poly(3-hydroxybutyrate) depolymerase
MNWVYVPDSYDPTRPLGLVIALHGGAGSSAQSSAAAYLESDTWLANLLRAGDFVVVCPSAPPLIYRWGSSKFKHPESEIHLQSVIEEYSTRYAIDANRVCLMGFSMGGIGSWWHALRQGDRFALIAPMAGSWSAAYWPKLRGVMLWMSNGVLVDYEAYDPKRVFEGGADGALKWERDMFAPRRDIMKAGAVEADNLGGNRFRVRGHDDCGAPTGFNVRRSRQPTLARTRP